MDEPKLTPRQRQVLEFIASGRTNPEIAEQLGISLDGAKWHVSEVLARLDVSSREAAAEWWRASRRRGYARFGWAVLGSAPLKAAGVAVGAIVVAGVVALAALVWRSNDSPAQEQGTIVAVPVAVGFGNQASAVLQDGRILITGGETDALTAEPGAIAYLLSPETHTIERITDMNAARSYHTATVLADGTVLLVGGGSAEIFDPATRRFELLDSRPLERSTHAAVLLPDGTVLVAGGLDSQFQPVVPFERYDPTTRAFEPLGVGVPAPGMEGLLLAGGSVFLRESIQFWILDPATGIISEPVAYEFANEPVITGTADGLVVLLGGTVLDSAPAPESVAASGAIVIVDPITLEQTLVGELLQPRHRAAAAGLTDGRVVIAGGSPDSHLDGGMLSTLEVVDPVTATSQLGGTMSEGRYRVEVLADELAVVILGSPTRDPATSIDIYIP